MGEDRDGHMVWYDNFNYDFKGVASRFSRDPSHL